MRLPRTLTRISSSKVVIRVLAVTWLLLVMLTFVLDARVMEKQRGINRAHNQNFSQLERWWMGVSQAALVRGAGQQQLQRRHDQLFANVGHKSSSHALRRRRPSMNRRLLRKSYSTPSSPSNGNHMFRAQAQGKARAAEAPWRGIRKDLGGQHSHL